MKKTALPPRKRAALKASDFAVPSERKYPINDLFHARLALTYVLSPSNAAYRDEVVSAVLARYPELQFWWAARSRNLAASTRRRPSARKVANPSHRLGDSMPARKLTRSRSNLALRRNTGIAGLEAFIASNLPGSGLKLRSVKSVPADFPTDEAVEVVFDTSYSMRDKYEAEDAVRKAFDDRDAYEMGVDVIETPQNSRVLHAKVSAHKRWFQTHMDAANARERAPDILGPNVGLNADWSSTAYYVAPRNGRPNRTQGAIYLFDTEDDDRWELVQRFDPEDGYETDIRVLETFDSLKGALDYIESHRDELEQRSHQKANPRRKLPKYGEGSGIISRARRGLGTKYRTMREGMLAEGGDVMRLPHRLPGHEGKSMTDLSDWGREEDYAYNDAKPILDLLASSNKPSLSLRTVVDKLRAQGMSGEEVFEGLTFLRSHDLINYEGGKPISLRQKANPRHKGGAKSHNTAALEARAIARGKREILEDIKSARVPSTARTFAELHDYVDANMYAGLADASSPLTGLSRHDERASMRRVQDALDAWLRMGRRAGGKHKVVSARRNPATLDQRRAELMAVCKRRGIPADASTPLNVLLERIMADDAARAERLRRNPLSEDGAVVSNPRRKGAANRAGKRTAAQGNAAKAMRLFHSGQASSLAEAWAMLRRR
jgi:hypothetical protein